MLKYLVPVSGEEFLVIDGIFKLQDKPPKQVFQKPTNNAPVNMQ